MNAEKAESTTLAVVAGQGGPTVCEACGSPLEADDDFCSECGLELPAGRELRRRRRLRFTAFAAALLAAVAAAATFGVLWQSEASRGDRARGELQTASSQTATSQATQERLGRELAATRLELAQVERLAEVRGGVLTQTKRAVEQVDPLLSSADSLRRLTAKIQTSRNKFADGATGVVDSLIAFSNAILRAQENGTALDDQWVGDQIDSINERLDAMGTRYDALDSTDAAYDKASRRFESRATDFNVVIRKLQQQLQAVVEG